MPSSEEQQRIFLKRAKFAHESAIKKQGRDTSITNTMFALLFDLEDYATTYRATRDAYLKAANEL